jgi:rhodanese-related sulfurtransferase
MLRISIASAFLGSLLICATTAIAAEHTADSLETVKENVAKKQAVLVDVREKLEWQGGHVAGAVFLPMSLLERKNLDPKLFEGIPKDRIVYTYCVVGMRAKKAADVLEKRGYQVRALKPGYEQLIKAGLPTAKGD